MKERGVSPAALWVAAKESHFGCAADAFGDAAALRGAWVQRTQDLATGGTLPVTGDRTALRFRRVDPQAPGLMPAHPIGP
jgi:hypothetical protein